MKKYLLGLFAVVLAVAFSAFNTKSTLDVHKFKFVEIKNVNSVDRYVVIPSSLSGTTDLTALNWSEGNQYDCEAAGSICTFEKDETAIQHETSGGQDYYYVISPTLQNGGFEEL
jgi:hypothetical protein